MDVIYARQPFPTTVQKTLFLAGPTPRRQYGKSWRNEALEILRELGFDGHVFLPEPEDGKWSEDYTEQVEWEDEGLRRCDNAIFWVPRDVKGDTPEGTGSPMPALTTNDEWGVWKDSGKVLWGNPPWAQHTRYQRHYAEKYGVPVFNTLKDLLHAAVERLGEGAKRTNGEVFVPLIIWQKEDFQQWYQSQLAAGNRLDFLDLKWSFFVGPKRRAFLYVIHPHVRISEESRVKTNEVVVVRPDVSSVVLYSRETRLLDTKIVLVKEFRSPVRNEESYVYELPGGSSKAGADPRETAAEEVFEEIGLKLPPDRFLAHGTRQMGATLTSYHNHLFSVELLPEQMAKLEADKEAHGNIEDSERTYIEIRTFREILSDQLVDWPCLGLISGALLL